MPSTPVDNRPELPAYDRPQLPAYDQRVVVAFLLGEAGLPVAEDELDELVSVFALVRGMTRILHGATVTEQLE